MDKPTFKLLPSETILDDEHPIIDMYVYIADGKFTRYTGLDTITVGEWKRRSKLKEIRRCQLFGPGREQARLGDAVQP